MNITIAIDGPAGSGKGTIAKELAKKYNLINIDTGATYRCVALKTLKENISVEETDKIIEISKNIDIELKRDGTVLLDGVDVTKEIRNKEVTSIVSQISTTPEVRENMVNIQRKIASNNNVVMEGRDITTVVLPNAKYKFYLDIKTRDYNDMNKKVGALKGTEEQVYIDTTNLTVEEELEIMSKIIEGENNEKNDR